MGTTGATGRSATLRASMATTSASTEPTARAARMPARSESLGTLRCRRSTSIRARVPAGSPSFLRAAAQSSSWMAVNAPLARVRASAVAPGNAPGLMRNTSR